MVSIAGILANLLIVIIGFVIFKALLEFGVINASNIGGGIIKPISTFLFNLIFLNVSLAVFNLMPFPPLDGSKILSTFLPESFQPVLDLLEQFGFIILLLLVYMGVFRAIISPVFRLVEYLLFTPLF